MEDYSVVLEFRADTLAHALAVMDRMEALFLVDAVAERYPVTDVRLVSAKSGGSVV